MAELLEWDYIAAESSHYQEAHSLYNILLRLLDNQDLRKGGRNDLVCVCGSRFRRLDSLGMPRRDQYKQQPGHLKIAILRPSIGSAYNGQLHWMSLHKIYGLTHDSLFPRLRFYCQADSMLQYLQYE